MRVLIFGDSTTYHSAMPDGGWVDYLRRGWEKELLTAKDDTHIPEVYNLGISGDISQDLLERIEGEIRARIWEEDELAVAILIGVNDSMLEADKERTTAEEYRSNLQEIVNKSRKFTNRILLVGLTAVDESRVNPASWRNISYNNDRIQLFDKQVQDIAKENDLPYIGLHKKFLNHPELLYDGAHQTTEGHKIIADTVKPAIEKLVQ